MKILIADDDPAMCKIIRLYFEKSGFTVQTASNGKEALDILCESPFDLAILDWMMPKISGEVLCRQIKQLKIPVKTILLTAKDRMEDELYGLESGADDYIRKPFEPRILILRAKKLLQAEETLHCGPITLNLAAQRADKDGMEIKLSKLEYDLLEFFLRNQGMILTRDVLLERIWGMDYEGDERTVDTHIKRLRSKIGSELIGTRRGLGYCMEKIL